MNDPARLLTIAISTVGSRIDSLRSWAFDPRIQYLVLWQRPAVAGAGWPANVTVVPLPDVGVTRSRNAAVERCPTPWLWFMDDDVQIPEASIDALLEDLPRAGANEMRIASVQRPDGRPLSRHETRQPYGRREILSVGTIQIIVNAAWVRQRRLRFPLRLGAGTAFPVCDEPVFLARALRAGARIVHADRVVVLHDERSSGDDLDQPALVRSRAIAFREIFGMPLCLLASLGFWWRHARAIGRRWPWLFHYGPAD